MNTQRFDAPQTTVIHAAQIGSTPAPQAPHLNAPAAAGSSNKSSRAVRLQLLCAVSAAVLAACGGGSGSDDPTAAGNGTSSAATADGNLRHIATSTTAGTGASATLLRVRAKGSMFDNVGPQMQVIVNGSIVSSVEVRASSYQDYDFTVNPIAAGSKVDIVFTNDARVVPQDRNLYLDTITVNGVVMSPVDPSVKYDRGEGYQATDGQYVLAGSNVMPWSGAMRFIAPAAAPAPAPAPTPAPPPPATVTSFTPSTGAAGTSVVITGTGLSNLTQVAFNGVASPSLTAVSATSVTAVVPAGATTGKITVSTGSTSVTSAAPFTVNVLPPTSYEACQAAPAARKVTDFGVFTANASDSTTRAANTVTINKAIDAVGKQTSGGVVCLPPGSYFLTNRAGGQQEAVVITHGNTTLWGAGMDATKGGTRLVTRSDWNLLNGEVFRGHGLRVMGTPWATPPLTNITLRDFEMDGGSGYSGNFSWPANPATGDGWDISHKGIILAWDDCVSTVAMQRVWVHSYKGEVIYAAGHCLQKVTVDSIRSEDTNASTFNITANFTVTNSYFGKSNLWMELGANGPYNSSTWTNNTFKDAARYGINITQGDGRANTPHVFKNNTFTSCGTADFFYTGFYFGGGAGGPITVTDNTFTNCSGFATDEAANAGPWAVATNQLINFSNNTLINPGTLAYLSHNLSNSTISGNIITNTTADVGATTATFLCDSNLTNVTFSGNTFDHTRTPEQSCPVTKGSRPKFQDNIYKSSESRYLQGTTHIDATHTLIRPQFEQAFVITDAPNMIAQFDTALYVDGQIVTVIGGSTSSPLRFPAGQVTYSVAAERKLTGGSLKFTYSAAQQKWIETLQ